MEKNMKCKKAIAIIAILFLILVGAVPTVCMFVPEWIANKTVAEELEKEPGLDLEITELSSGDLYLTGKINNPSKLDYTTFVIYAYGTDASQTEIYTATVVVSNIKAESQKSVYQRVTFSDEVVYYLSDEFAYEYEYSYEYESLSPFVFYMIGFGVWFISLLFFQRKKLTFEMGSHKVEVLAGMAKLKVAIDGKIYKDEKLKTRFEKAEAKYKVAGQILNVQFKAGLYFPNVKITVDGVEPKFTKIQQHSFLKLKEEKKADPEKLVQG